MCLMKKSKVLITVTMLHKNLCKDSLDSFHERNSQNKDFSIQFEKREFLMTSFGLLGALPLFQLFKVGKYQAPYFFMASLRGGHVSELDAINFRNKTLLDALDNKMLKEEKILKMQFVSLKKKTSWMYVFNSRDSYWKWHKAVEEIMHPVKRLPSNFQYFQLTGFLNSKKDKATVWTAPHI